MLEDQAGSGFAPQSLENSGYKTFYEYMRDVEGWEGDQNAFSMAHNGILGWLDDTFFGIGKGQEERYNTWLANNQREYEQKQINDARAYETYLESTKYQRAAKDLQAAGLNPWLAVQNGLGNASVNPGHSSYSTSGYKYSKRQNKTSDVSSVVSSAMRLAMLAIAMM